MGFFSTSFFSSELNVDFQSCQDNIEHENGQFSLTNGKHVILSNDLIQDNLTVITTTCCFLSPLEYQAAIRWITKTCDTGVH